MSPTSNTSDANSPSPHDLFDFPAPPTQNPGSHTQPNEQCAIVIDTPDATDQSFCNSHDQHHDNGAWTKSPVSAQNSDNDIIRPRRMSRSTTSLPMLSNQDKDDTALENALERSGNFRSGKFYMQPRAAKSHHNLCYIEDTGALSQSLLSLMSKGERMPEVADLLSPIASQSYESDIDQSSIKATVQSQVLEPMEPQPSPMSTYSNSIRSLKTTDASSYKSPERPPVLLRKQMSMAQMEDRLNNRNSMVISDMYFSGAVDDNGVKGRTLPASMVPEQAKVKRRQSRFQLDLDFQLDKSSRRTSRFLYDVPSSSPTTGMQSTLARALQWSHRISHNGHRPLKRASSSIVDQHKIYEIYEESIWHSTETPESSSPMASTAPKPRFGLGFTGGQRRSISGSINKAKTISSNQPGTRLNILRSVKSASVPWSMIRSWKNRHAQESKETDWDLSSASSTFSSEYCSTISSAGDKAGKKPTRKQSTIHLFVKRAGRGLLRRSTSFYKSISGATLTSHSRSIAGNQSSFSGTSSTMSSEQPQLKDKPKMGSRLAMVMRQAGSKLKETLKLTDKAHAVTEHDEEVVSAYPADSLTSNDMYLSMSALHSPVLSAPVNSRAGSGSDDACVRGTAADTASSKQMPYLSLHRGDRVFATGADDGHMLASHGGALPLAPQAYHGHYPTMGARLRPTQFNSPFTTLPYGAYVQHHQPRSQLHYM
ncbi:hypothetical protein H4R22_001180 [Coemansia sp. RSA 1290]|nr:hypothetical protein H4R22_001180 [Coemansia sp. RSA 1290]KAJ2648971.1 hypothetical protein IWW40_003515 [Coemansia sp. RSA 1250]